MTGEHAAYRAAGVRYALWMGGSRGEFDRELETIEAKVIELLGLVVEDLAAATQALLGNDGETGGILAEREQLIDALYVEIEDLAVREILLQAPVAADLRFLLTVLRVVPELERSHDLVVRIASQASLIRGGDLPPGVTGLAGRMADLVSVMWRQAADAWYERDRSVAAALRAARCRQAPRRPRPDLPAQPRHESGASRARPGKDDRQGRNFLRPPHWRGRSVWLCWVQVCREVWSVRFTASCGADYGHRHFLPLSCAAVAAVVPEGLPSAAGRAAS